MPDQICEFTLAQVLALVKAQNGLLPATDSGYSFGKSSLTYGSETNNQFVHVKISRSVFLILNL